MIKPNETSMYSFVDDNHIAPTLEKGIQITERKPLIREQNWQNAEKVNERYQDSLPDHVKDAMTVTQKDLSFYAFFRFAMNHSPRDNFESQVNQAHVERFGKLMTGFNFIEERERYILFYRGMMG